MPNEIEILGDTPLPWVFVPDAAMRKSPLSGTPWMVGLPWVALNGVIGWLVPCEHGEHGPTIFANKETVEIWHTEALSLMYIGNPKC